MLLTFLLAIPVLRPRYRALLLLLVGAGVILTFSRAAILGWMLLWLFLLLRKAVPKYTLAVPLVALGALPLLLGSFESYLSGREDLSEGLDNILARLEFFQDQALDDDSALERAQVLEAGLDLFLENPIFGAGAGATHLWSLAEQHTQPACHARCRVRCLRDSAMVVVSRDPMEGKVFSGQDVSANSGYRICLPVDVYHNMFRFSLLAHDICTRCGAAKGMKLVVIITGTGVGGAEIMLHKVLTRLSPEFKPHVISMNLVGEIGEKIRALGIPVESLDMRPGVPDPVAFIRLIRDLRRLKPDLVHTWMYHADLMGGVAARLARVPALAWCIRHSNLAPADNKSQILAVVRANAFLSHRVPDRILCCSEAARKIHVACGYAPEKMVVIPNGFDLAHFKPDPNARLSVRAELGLPLETALVGLIGRWDPQKNHAGFFAAAATLHLRRPDVHFLLAGHGVDGNNQTIQRTLGANGLTAVTHLLGLRDDIPRLMAALDVLASSSSYGEAFPNVLGEAMASGVPCAVTDVGDSAYIVGDTGRVVSSGDMEGLAHAIDSLSGGLASADGNSTGVLRSTRARSAPEW